MYVALCFYRWPMDLTAQVLPGVAALDDAPALGGSTILNIRAREIFDSRGNPTVEVGNRLRIRCIRRYMRNDAI